MWLAVLQFVLTACELKARESERGGVLALRDELLFDGGEAKLKRGALGRQLDRRVEVVMAPPPGACAGRYFFT